MSIASAARPLQAAIRCVGLIAALVFALPGISYAQTVLVGSYSYTYSPTTSGGTVSFTASELHSNWTSRTTGTLRLELWATTTPYSGGSLSGWRLGSYQLSGSTNGTLTPGASFTNVSATVSIASNPPAGSYYVTLIIGEFTSTCTTSDQFCIAGYGGFANQLVKGTAGTQTSTAGSSSSDDFAASATTTGTVAVGGTKSGSIETSGDVDWFSVSLTSGTSYQIDVRGSATSGGTLADPFVALRNSSGTLLDDDDDSGSGLDAQLIFTPTTSGTYYVAASAYSTTTGTYTVAVTSTTSGSGGSSTGGGGTSGSTGDVTFTAYSVPGLPIDIAAGSDNNIWFTLQNENSIGRMTTSGSVTTFPLLHPNTSADITSGIRDIVAGPDGNLWVPVNVVEGFVASGAYTPSYVARVTPSGVITEFPVGVTTSMVQITRGPDGNLWLAGRMGTFSGGFFSPVGSWGRLTTAGALTPFQYPGYNGSNFTEASAITTGSDNNLWMIRNSAIVRATTTGSVTAFAIPTSNSSPGGIATGADGNVWFTEYNSKKIGRVTPAGVITEFAMPSTSVGPNKITAGPDGNMWFTTYGAQIGRITPAGVITMYTPGSSGSVGNDIVAGPDGNLWFAMGYQIFKAAIPAAAATPMVAGPVYSTAQAASQSFLRFYNTGATAGTVTATLRDYTSGQSVGQWTSSSIPAGGELQFAIGTIESEMGLTTKPAYYSVSVQPNISGYFQHVLFRPTDGTLTNLSTCATGVTADPIKLSGVHTSTVGGFGFPSTVVVNNTGSTAQTVSLGVYNAVDGALLGTMTTTSIPANAQLMLTSSQIEAGAGFTPTASMGHYVIKAGGTFTGFLQHLVDNQRAGVITDMTTSCALSGTASMAGASPLKAGAIFSTAQSSSQSFLRFYNTGTSAGTATVTLRDYVSGQQVGQWTTPTSIPGGSEQQYPISTIESGLTGTKPAYYSVSVTSGFSGYFQHVLFRPADGTLTNLSTCAAGVTADASKLSGVHTSTVGGFGFPSTVVVNNTGSVAETVSLGVFNAVDGARLGTMTTTSIPANGQIMLTSSQIETGAGFTPTANMGHYVIKAEGAFTGFLQHLVTNQRAGVTTDMTTACAF